ncbi:MAG: M16 family metallopeptidase [Candidatus Aminicenantia bacterium]
MKRYILPLVLLLIVLSSYSLGQFSGKVLDFTLSNGMRFFVLERHRVPTFAGVIMVKVGSVDEGKGETGIAHFFEHMAFKGTPVIGSKNWEKEKKILDEMDKVGDELTAEYARGNSTDLKKIEALRARLAELQNEHRKYVVKDEIDKIYSENGGEFLNASTGNDTTQYFVMLPSNRLELWFLIESERFKYPSFREFYSERDVVCEERKMYEDNSPDGFLDEEFYHLAFVIHPYRHPVVGYMEDLLTLSKKKAIDFYKSYYIPNNMVAGIVGDVKFEDVKKLAEKYFGDIPARPEPTRPELLEPPQKGERRVIVKFDAEPRIQIGFHIPEWSEKENIVLEVISYILGRGESSRLRRDLVINRKIAQTVSVFLNDPGVRYKSLFTIYCQPRHPHTTGELEKAIYEHLERLKKEPVPKEELEKAFNQAEAYLYRSTGFAENLFIAWRILRNVLLFNDIDADFKRVAEMKKVTTEEIMEVAKKYFTEKNRIVGILLRREKAE